MKPAGSANRANISRPLAGIADPERMKRPGGDREVPATADQEVGATSCFGATPLPKTRKPDLVGSGVGALFPVLI